MSNKYFDVDLNCPPKKIKYSKIHFICYIQKKTQNVIKTGGFWEPIGKFQVD